MAKGKLANAIKKDSERKWEMLWKGKLEIIGLLIVKILKNWRIGGERPHVACEEENEGKIIENKENKGLVPLLFIIF